MGAPWESPLFEELHDLGIETIDGTDSTLEQMVQQIASCDVVIAGDTGPLQIARALSIPVVALFGPSHESRHEFEDIDVVLTENLSCRPCSPHGHHTCPLKHHACMQDLDGKRVLGAVLKVVNS
uniref:ADP-heptose:LPS heptosyltransferase n=1 Tax=uncultured myxobacterium HF0070_11L13 TaxID=723554 RepID=E7C225_9BACT|nr:ADP-heptose:LPS heptosyltransferase [uncultured myxobacterium HF0070_11L13]